MPSVSHSGAAGPPHLPRAAAPADLAAPGAGERRHRPVNEDLDGVAALRGVGEVPQAQVEPQLLGAKVGDGAGHGDSVSGEPVGNVPPSPRPARRSRRLTRRSASRRPVLGREAGKSPCQHLGHNCQARTRRDGMASEFPGSWRVPGRSAPVDTVVYAGSSAGRGEAGCGRARRGRPGRARRRPRPAGRVDAAGGRRPAVPCRSR